MSPAIPTARKRAKLAFAIALTAGLSAPAMALAAGSITALPAEGLMSMQPMLLPPAEIAAPRVHVAQSQESAQLALRLQQLEEQIRSLTGQVEGLQFQLTQMQTLLQKQSEDYEFRFGQLEGGAGGKTEAATQSGGVTPAGEAPQAPAADVPAQLPADPTIEENTIPADPNAIPEEGVSVGPDEMIFDPTYEDGMPMDDLGTSGDPLLGTGQGVDGAALGTGEPLTLNIDPNAVAPDADAEAQYKAGYDALVGGNYGFAEEQFRQFIALYPNDPQAADATNWLGEALIQQGAWDDAAEVLLGGFQTYPQSARAPDMLLKLGIALNGAGERETACRTFAEVPKRYSGLTAAFQTRLNQELVNAQCPPG